MGKIHSTYMYLAGSIGMTALSAVAVSRTPALMGPMMSSHGLAMLAKYVAMIGAGQLVRSISYDQSPMRKHLAWMFHAGVMGAVIAPGTLLGGPLMMRAAWYTTGMVGGLSTVAMCAPLAVGFGVIFGSAIGWMFPPPTSAFGAGVYGIAVYGGLLLCSAFLLYGRREEIIKRAETHPLDGDQRYDPINACVAFMPGSVSLTGLYDPVSLHGSLSSFNSDEK